MKNVEFAASAPLTYDHAVGGGAFDDRTIGVGDDVVKSLEGGNFSCGDLVTFLISIEIEETTVDPVQTAEFDLVFTADTTGQPGAAIADIVRVQMNYGSVVAGDGPGGTDAFISDDGGSVASLVSESLTGPVFTSGSDLLGTVRVTDLEPGENLVVRVDVRIDCDPGSSPTGNLQARIDAARIVTPAEDSVNVGDQTIPFKKVGDLSAGEPSLTLVKSVTTENGSCGADDVDELTVALGDSVKYCYVLTNTGTAPLFDVSVVDDNGTPANIEDDFSVNLSGLQDLDEEGDLGDLAAGAMATGEVVIQLNASGTVINLACASGHDGADGELEACDTATVYVPEPPNQPPLCDAGGPYEVECQGATTSIDLSAFGSFDPDEDELAYRWESDCPGAAFDDPNSPNPVLTLDSGDCFVQCKVTVSVSDGENDAVSCEAMVTVSDSTDPEIECPEGLELECADPNGIIVEYSDPVASDQCDQDLDVTCDPPSGSAFLPGITTVTCVATDCAGNQVSCTFDVVVIDRVPPVIVCPEDVEIYVSDLPATPLEYEVSVTDGCDSEPALICDPPPGTVFPPGETVVVCMAIDEEGNVAHCDFVVRVSPCVDFDESFRGEMADQTVITSQYQPLGCMVAGMSDLGLPGAVARTAGAPGSSTDDLIPVTPPNYLQTMTGAGDSDSGSILFSFVDPDTAEPRPISTVSLSFLDIEDSGSGPGGRGHSRLEALDAEGNPLETVLIPVGPNAGVFQAEIGDEQSNLSIYSVRAVVGDLDDSGGVDQLCFLPRPEPMVSRLLGSGSQVAMGDGLGLYLFERANRDESVSVQFELIGTVSLQRPGRTLVGPELRTLPGGATSMVGPDVVSLAIPTNRPRLANRDVYFIARYSDPENGELLSESIVSVRIVP